MNRFHPSKILVLAYLFYSCLGFFILALPICHEKEIPLIDTFFTSVSALSTTGLASIDIGSEYNLLGQIVIIILIQLGGIGYMTFSSFVLLCTSQKLSAYRRKIGASTFAFPKDFSIHEFIKSVIIYSFLCELIGAIILSLFFWSQGIERFIWQGIFHSISSFCTAGISLFKNSFIPFQENIGFIFVVSAQMILGSLGFIVALDFYKKWRKEKKSVSFTTRVILAMTLLFLVGGTLIFFVLETIKYENILFDEWMIAIFQTVSAVTTTGFNSVDIGILSSSMLILLSFLSTFGAAPSGTGGGLKNTAFASLVAFVKNTLKGKPTTLWHHIIPPNRVRIATVAFIWYIFSLSLAFFLLTISEGSAKPLDIFFEAANALNNSGLSTGLTFVLTDFGKCCISFLMIMGRVGVLTFGVAISSHKEETDRVYKKAELIT